MQEQLTLVSDKLTSFSAELENRFTWPLNINDFCIATAALTVERYKAASQDVPTHWTTAQKFVEYLIYQKLIQPGKQRVGEKKEVNAFYPMDLAFAVERMMTLPLDPESGRIKLRPQVGLLIDDIKNRLQNAGLVQAVNSGFETSV